MMRQTTDNKSSVPLLEQLEIKTNNKVLFIKENQRTDGNFVITHLIQKIINDNGKICLVIFHNTIGHYHNVGKRLGYDFLDLINKGFVEVIDVLKTVGEEIDVDDDNNSYITEVRPNITNSLQKKILEKMSAFGDDTVSKHLIIDDVSHLGDLYVDLKHQISFVNFCANLTYKDNTFIVMAAHIGNKTDEILSNSINYVADLTVELVALKTGTSKTVTGVISVKKTEKDVKSFHYKALDKYIHVFNPGESLNYLLS